MSRQETSHIELMRAMGAPRGDGFNPIPPRTHRQMMDVRNPETVRISGWCLWRTIDLDRDGRTGPKKVRRTPTAHDERGHLGPKHIAQDLDMSLPNVYAALKRAVENGEIRIDEKGRISPRGDAPEPRRINPEPDEENSEEDICTDILPRPLALYLERLDENRAAQCIKDYLELQEHARKVEADAIAAARAQSQELLNQWYGTIGFAYTEPRGRRREPRPDSTVQLALVSLPKISVQISEPTHSVQNENRTVQISASLVTNYTENNRVSEEPAPAPQPPEVTPPPATLTHSKNIPVESETPDPVIDTVERSFARTLPPADPLRAKFADLPTRFEIPAAAVCRFLLEKLEQKTEAGYTVNSPGALYKIASEDLPAWIRSHRRQIHSAQQHQPQPQPAHLLSPAEEIASLLEWIEEFPDHQATPRARERLRHLQEEPTQ